MIILGIDPGISAAGPGALCIMQGDTKYISTIFDMPTLAVTPKSKKRSLDYHALAGIIVGAHAGHAFVEKSWNRPGEGHSGALVGCYMAILATLTTAGVPWTAIAPQVWKKALSVPDAKDGARARASQLLPDGQQWWPLVKHHGRAEAALIAVYGLRGLGLIEPPQPRLLPLPQLRPLVP